MNSGNTNSLRNTLINQVQGAGVITLQQKKNWLIDWYFSNDPMGSIYLATLRNPALVSTYQTNPGMLYGTPFATGMENYFQKIKNYFGQSMFDQLVTEFAQQSNLYVDEIKVDEFHLYGSNRLGVYEANKPISRRVARDLNNDNQISNNEYVVETPEEVLYLFSSYQLERGAKRYELANHLGNVLTVISDKKTANFTGSTFTHFTAERISATDYSPFGAPLAGRTWQEQEYSYGFNGMEKDDEANGSGVIYTSEFRQNDTRLGRWLSVDALFKKFPWQSPYISMDNNPILLSDPNGDSTFVKGNPNGTFEVIGGNLKGNDKGIYIYEEGKYTGKKLGESITTHSFVDEAGNFVKGAIIDPKSNEGQKFIDDEIVKGDPNIFYYMLNGYNHRKLDFKERGIEKRGKKSPLQHVYRGSVTSDGKFGSARDFGNIAAGVVAARFGLTWSISRFGFDLLQRGIEPPNTQLAQLYGFKIGLQLWSDAENRQLYRAKNHGFVEFGKPKY